MVKISRVKAHCKLLCITLSILALSTIINAQHAPANPVTDNKIQSRGDSALRISSDPRKRDDSKETQLGQPLGKNYDYFGNDLADFAVFTFPAAGGGAINWRILKNENPSPTGPGQATLFDIPWGQTASDAIPNVGDYDGNGITDLSIHRNHTGVAANTYYTLPITNSGLSAGDPIYQQWGNSAIDFIGAEGDYDGDGITDYTAVRPSAGIYVWYILQSSDNTVKYLYYGRSDTDIPLGGADYTGDGIDDPTIVRIGNGGDLTWYVGDTNNGIQIIQDWGNFNTDFVVPGGDYDGDGKADFMYWRGFGSGTDGSWNLLTTSGNSSTIQFGIGGSSAVRDTALRGGDYDGDGMDDIAVYRNANNEMQFRVRKSSDGSTLTQQWGTAGNSNLPVASFGVQ